MKNLYDPIVQWLTGGSGVPFGVQIVIRIVLSCAIAAILGVERANKRHAAGLRTFILVALGSTVAALTDLYLISECNVAFPALSAGTAVGIALISSYTILYSSRNQIKGLTTAAALWGQAFIGFAVGFGLYTMTLISLAVLLLCLSGLPRLEIFLKNRSAHFEVQVEFKNKTDLPAFVDVLRQLGIKVDDIEANPAYANTGLSVYTVSLSVYSKELKKYKTHGEIIDAVRRSLPYVYHIEEILS